MAHGSWTADAALAGSSAAFLLRTVVLAMPFALVLLRWRRSVAFSTESSLSP